MLLDASIGQLADDRQSRNSLKQVLIFKAYFIAVAHFNDAFVSLLRLTYVVLRDL